MPEHITPFVLFSCQIQWSFINEVILAITYNKYMHIVAKRRKKTNLMTDTRPFTQCVSGRVIVSGSNSLFFSLLLFDILRFRAGLQNGCIAL